ncbi:MAG: helix-turn-helix transcriptional regulator [Rhizobiaceae bacterium]|nr:helix-turn-helix transcriptional regulator [Rhizobiaceae bacterium]
MNSIARLQEPIQGLALPTSRPELIRFLNSLCSRVRADYYLVAELHASRGDDEVRIVASNWMFDTIDQLGASTLLDLAAAPVTGFAGAAPRIWHPGSLEGLTDDQAGALDEAGHSEFASTRLRAGVRHYLLLLSAPALRLDAPRIPAAVMSLSYALSAMATEIAEELPDYPISERERECLGWVAEGKTTLDIAMILGVSSNTINSYLAHVIQKLAARNRAMAIAVAIRSGII